MNSIKPGDLVVTVHDCCGRYIGSIFTVQDVRPLASCMRVSCDFCKWESAPGITIAVSDAPPLPEGKLKRPPLSWLRRIPPLEEPQQEHTLEEISA